jgi:hypothetical protein
MLISRPLGTWCWKVKKIFNAFLQNRLIIFVVFLLPKAIKSPCPQINVFLKNRKRENIFSLKITENFIT